MDPQATSYAEHSVAVVEEHGVSPSDKLEEIDEVEIDEQEDQKRKASHADTS